MPELPEVETIRRVIAPWIAGRSILSVETPGPEAVARPSAEEFAAALAGQVFAGAERRGKYTLWRLESGDRLALHLRMTGVLLLEDAAAPRGRFLRVAMRLDDGRELRYEDMRRFGRMWLLHAGEEDAFSGMASLGPEPDDARVTAEYLSRRLSGTRRPVKACLMDQSIVAGIGNIYSDEILFAAGIDPARPGCSLREEEIAALARRIPETMAFFVEKNAISPEEYLRTRGQEYRNTPFLRVYGRDGQPCARCGAALVRTVICGRGSVRCPHCQR